MNKKKIAIVGAGNAGCITALYYYMNGNDDVDKIQIYYDPNTPIERVGQGTIIGTAELISVALNLNWYSNPINATFKTGILYENWGKKNDKIFHPFLAHDMAFHYVPNLLSKAVLESGHFEVIEKNVQNPEEEIDADFIFDCRGRSKNNSDDYNQLINPLNAVVLSRKEGRDPDLIHTRCVATPDGWTFVIPNTDSVSYGYLYNNKITDKETATQNFIDLFDVVPDGDLTFNNYVAKNAFVGDRTILNGNRLSFLEPLEASSTGFYLSVSSYSHHYIVGELSKEECNRHIQNEMKQIESFVLWHYQFGSKYDTPFWEYAKSLPFNPDESFKQCLEYSKKDYINLIKNSEESPSHAWHPLSFKNWNENIQ